LPSRFSPARSILTLNLRTSLIHRSTSHNPQNARIDFPLCLERGGGLGTHGHHISGVERKQPDHKRVVSLWHAMDVPM
jgi:hypothetical protein